MKRRISHSDISKAFSPDPTALLTQLGELNVAAQPVSRLATDDGSVRKATTPLSTASLSIAGQVIEQKSGLPLAGVMVKWTLSPTHTRANNHRRNEIGSALTNDEGRFFIDAAASPEAKADLCRIAGEKRNGTTYLCLADRNEKMIGHPIKVPADTREIILHPPGGVKKPSKKQWKALTNYLTTNRMMLVRDLAQQLARPFADSPIQNWAVADRTSALRDLLNAEAKQLEKMEQAFDLLYQNQFIDTTSLEEGNVRRAVTHFADERKLGKFLPSPDKIFPWLRDSDRSLYRDYLRGVWVAAAQKMYEELTSIAKPSASALEEQLDERFEQDFHTSDDTSSPAAKLLIPLLVSILTRDEKRGGFGFKPADIPAQGTQINDEYLQVLIGTSKVSAQELRNRFRVSFDRAPGETTSSLQLNVEALLGLLADTYQSPEEPFNAIPAIFDNGKPLIFGPYIGRAPFFLEYEEWLERQRAFFPENIYDIRRNIPVFDPDYRTSITAVKVSSGPPQFPGQGYFDDYAGERGKSGGWIERMFPVVDKIRDALGKMDGQRYAEAKDGLNAVRDELWKMAKDYDSKWVKDKFWWWWSWGAWNNKPVTDRAYSDTYVGLKDRAKIHVTSPDELTGFEKFFDAPFYPKWTGNPGDWSSTDYETAEKAIAKARSLYLYNVFYLHDVLIPYLQSQMDFAVGNFAQAVYALSLLTGYRVGIAETAAVPGYDTKAQSLGSTIPLLYQQTTLPYTTLVGFEDNITYTDLQPIFNESGAGLSSSYGRLFIAPFELRFFKLAQAEVILAWADQLYRNDDPSSIRRARELYKGVLFMHGEDPEIAPHFDRSGKFHLGILGGEPLFWKYTDNPARVSQLTRARLALYQIDQGLNVYGYRDDMVPVLRYKPLKQAADLFATSAKSAQTDFLNYMTRYEQALIELWQTQSLVKKAQAASGIASEHVAIAQVGVDKAKEQVAAVQAQIVAKQKEIADKNSLFDQFSDYLSGAKDALTGLVPLAQKVMADDSAAGSVTGEQMLDIFSKGVSGGASGAKDAATATLGSGAAFVIGYGAFAYASYTSMEAMAAASAKRDGELKALQTTALDAANAQVRLKQRDVAIAQYESQIAAADLEFANALFRFQQDRFLNADFWNKLTLFANRLMRRYVELGARTAWMAERALAFEQNRAISVIKLNYLPIALRGVTGADRLLADLAELEANRIQGTRFTTPVKHTISLAREFPIAFGQLKKTGRCRFHTREADLRAAYPGTFAYRIRAITVAVSDAEGAAPRGILRNGGVSIVSAEDLTNKVLVRYPDALALSEFRLHDDLFVYGLPGETLLQFEGSGFETDWELEFPIEANRRGLRSVADILITFDSNAYYSDGVAAKEAVQPLADAPRSIMLAASNVDPKGLDTLKATSGAARITFDSTKLALPLQETKRQVANLAIICVGKTTKKYDAKLTASKSAKTATFKIEDGIAMSNGGPLQGTAAALPLNALVGLNVNQPLVLEIDRTGAAAELKQLFDVVLYLEYVASF
jgi:hypothetical protein